MQRLRPLRFKPALIRHLPHHRVRCPRPRPGVEAEPQRRRPLRQARLGLSTPLPTQLKARAALLVRLVLLIALLHHLPHLTSLSVRQLPRPLEVAHP